MKKLINLLIFGSLMNQTIAQTTNHGIDTNWYQTPKAAVTSVTPNLKGAVANNVVVKSNGTVIIFYRQGGQNKWIQSPDGGNTRILRGNQETFQLGFPNLTGLLGLPRTLLIRLLKKHRIPFNFLK